VIASACFYSLDTEFPGAAALVPVLGTALALVAGAVTGGRGIGRLLNGAPLQYLGARSYGWYLWHWPVLVYLAVILPGASLLARCAALAASLGIASASLRWLENPVRYHPRLVRDPGRSLALALALTVLALASGGTWRQISEWRARSPDQLRYAAVAKDVARTVTDGCMAKATTQPFVECVYGDSASSRIMVLLGDSHASQWFPALDRIARNRGLRLVTLLRAGCPAASVTILRGPKNGMYRLCDGWREDAFARIQELEPEAVVLSSFMGYLDGIPHSRLEARITPDEWSEGYRKTFAKLDALGVDTWLIRDPPQPVGDVPRCLSKSAQLVRVRERDSCVVSRREGLPDFVFHAEKRAATQFPRVQMIDLSDQFCDVDQCPPIIGGRVVYKDGDHLTATFAATLAPVLEAEMIRLDTAITAE
jgi:hypothetical protein